MASRKELVVDGLPIVVPVSDEAQAAYASWLWENIDSLAARMRPHGLDPKRDLLIPRIDRVVFEDEVAA